MNEPIGPVLGIAVITLLLVAIGVSCLIWARRIVSFYMDSNLPPRWILARLSHHILNEMGPNAQALWIRFGGVLCIVAALLLLVIFVRSRT